MTNKQTFYVTTSIMYANAEPHIGFALELIQADVLARYHRMLGEDVYFLTGTDEHGMTVARAAEKQSKEPQKLTDEIAGRVEKLAKLLDVSNDDFIRTTDRQRHWPAVEKLWRTLQERGDLYKKKYEGLYCVGHESFIKKSELQDGLCPLHRTAPEKIEEENWFFALTKYKDEVRHKIESGELRIVPETRKQEILNLLDDAEDISFSRSTHALTWGIPVPDDPGQTIYVWADALTNYISALGYGTDEAKMKYWPADVHLIGKDIFRFHAMIWPAMLLSAGVPLPKAIYVHGFITIDGQKMSKTVGNIIDPFKVAEKYGSEVVRYFLLREIPSGDDGDFSYKNLEARYNADLANGLGNLVQRVATLIENNLDGELIFNQAVNYKPKTEGYETALEQFRLHDAMGEIWGKIAEANQYVDDRKPWAEEKPDQFLVTMTTLVVMIHHITRLLQPFMPETSKKIASIFGDDLKNKDIPDSYKFIIRKGEPLFPRLQ